MREKVKAAAAKAKAARWGPEQIAKLKEAIGRATTVEEVDLLEHALRTKVMPPHVAPPLSLQSRSSGALPADVAAQAASLSPARFYK